MKYLNDNYVDAINKNSAYKAAIIKIKSEVDDFYSDFHDDPSVISEWGHYYFCNYDGGRLIYDRKNPHSHKCEICSKDYTDEVYDGVFVKKFVLFFGESVLYYMTEQEKAEEKITESACLNCRNVPDEEAHGRYEMLNDMLMHHAMGEREMQKREMKQYYGMQMVTNEVFRIL